HHQLDRVERVGPEVVDEGGLRGHLVLGHPHLLADDLDHAFFHGHGRTSSIPWNRNLPARPGPPDAAGSSQSGPPSRGDAPTVSLPSDSPGGRPPPGGARPAPARRRRGLPYLSVVRVGGASVGAMRLP